MSTIEQINSVQEEIKKKKEEIEETKNILGLVEGKELLLVLHNELVELRKQMTIFLRRLEEGTYIWGERLIHCSNKLPSCFFFQNNLNHYSFIFSRETGF